MKRILVNRNILISAAILLSVFGAAGSVAAQAPPDFGKAFLPATIGPGSTSLLSFTITNSSGNPVTSLAFTDDLPAGLTLATPANPVSTCGGTLTAPDGGGTITFSDGLVSGSSTCTITVAVTSGTAGLHQNVSGDLTSSAGNSGTASADLTVVIDRPGFSKSFAPSTVSYGARSTLTFTIDNTLNQSTALNLSFTDALPVGMVVADPALTSTTCIGGTITATPGSGTIAYGFDGSVGGLASCTVSIDVIAENVGSLVNVSGPLTSLVGFTTVESGLATAALEVTASTVFAVKSFTDDPVAPGDTVTLEFTVTNNDRSDSATDISFTDDLDATLSGLVATGLPSSGLCGPGSSISGTGLLTFTGGNLAPESSCTFDVTLQVPTGAAGGVYPNVTSAITATLGGSPFVGDPASDSLLVNFAPQLTKTFLANPIGAGDTATMEFTITNTSSTLPATDIAFTDNLDIFLSGVTVSSLPPAGSCGPGSTVYTFTNSGDLHLGLIGGNLSAGASCAFQVDLQLPVGGAPGTFINTTSPVAALVGVTPQVGHSATDSLTVVTAPRLTKTFTDDPVAPGGTTTLEFTLTHDPAAVIDATAITFSDDLNATLPGLTAVGLPMNDVCGTGSQISGTTNLAFTGGTLAPGASCTFSITLQTPAAALPGSHSNTTSNVVASIAGVSTAGNPAQDDLQISGLSFSKSFTDDPVIPGETVTLEFTIDNTSATADATGVFFTDSLSTTLSGLTATGLPLTDICGAGSQISGTTFLTFTGGNLTAGTSCTFSVTLDVPAAAVPNTYGNTTSNLTATIGGSTAVLPPASDQLVVNDTLLELTKEFTDDPVAPGDTVTLEFTLTNLDPADSATGITFTDDLDAALSGLVATGLPINDVCGAGSQISGTDLLTLTGGNLATAGSCTFSVTLQVPAGLALGTSAINTTSSVSGTIRGLAVTGAPATDTLQIDSVAFTKAFDGPVGAGGTAVLTFVINNLDATNSVTGLAFSDDLDAVLSGLVATGLPMTDVCGAGSQISGTSFLTLTSGELLPSGSCTVNVTVQVPPTATAGTFPNITSDLTSSGITVASPATASLQIEPPPTFGKAFAPSPILTNSVSTLTFTIDNSAAIIAATGLDFTDTLPAGTVVATPANAMTTCTGGTLTAVSGSGVVSYIGGTVAAGSTCTVSADVAGLAAGAHVNTSGDLTSSLGSSGPAAATLTVVDNALTLAKNFLTAPVLRGGTVTLEFTLTNSSAFTPLTNIAFTDNLDAVVSGLAAVGLPAADICGAGSMLTGTTNLALTGGVLPPMGSCTFSVSVAVPPNAPIGTFGNITSPVTALALGLPVSSAATTADLQTGFFAFDKSFLSSAFPGDTVDLEFTISNPDPANGAAAISFTDDLDATVPGMAAVGLPMADVCGAGSQITGTSVLTLTGGTLAAGAPCTFAVTLQIPNNVPGSTYLNTTSILSATVGGGSVAADPGSEASDLLTIDDPAPLFAKDFSPAAIALGATSSLTFTIDNSVSGSDATSLDFTDNLPAGMEIASPANAATTCVGGTLTAVAGTGTVSYTGGTATAGSVCAVSVDITGIAVGDLVNTSGDLSSSAGSSGTATATLTVAEGDFILSKSFLAGPVLRGGTVDLEFTLTNLSAASALSDITFTDDLDAVIPGLAAIGLPLNDVCGAGSLLAGTSTLTLTGGNLAPQGSCTFVATIVVPADAPIGVFTNTTSAVTANAGLVAVTADPASADLETSFFAFEKAFLGTAMPGGTVDLEFTISNPDPVNSASGISFTDDLDAVLPGLTATGLPQADVCGAGSQIDGTSTITLTGGNLGPGETCVFMVTLDIPDGSSNGNHTNLTSPLDAIVGGSAVAGDSGSEAFAILQINQQPAIPVLDPRGMMVLAALMAMIGFCLLRLRR